MVIVSLDLLLLSRETLPLSADLHLITVFLLLLEMNPIAKVSLLLSACVIVLCAGSPAGFRALDTGIAPLADDVNYRLSGDVIPINYDLEITPYFETVRMM